jgi:Protein of unknown function (DUF2934)
MPKTVGSKAAPIASPEPQPIDEASRATHEEIALRAYHIYLERDGAEGSALEDWLQAERELAANR